jgi:hypothetical protein
MQIGAFDEPKEYMNLIRRVQKLERAIRMVPCTICRDWWQGPVVIREDTDPPAPRDPDRCSSCGRKRPEGLVLEVIWGRQTGLEDPPSPHVEL